MKNPVTPKMLALASALCLAAGCEWDGDGDGPDPELVADAAAASAAARAQLEDPAPASETEKRPAESIALEYRYGGFDGSRAVETAAAQISGLRVTASGMSYSWERGGCEALGASGASDYSATVACIFYESGGKWIGGKFDWISTSRRSRDFVNIRAGYNGWDSAAFFAAKRHAFCIVGKDGKKRTNIITD